MPQIEELRGKRQQTDPAFSKAKYEKVGHPESLCESVVGVKGAPPVHPESLCGSVVGVKGAPPANSARKRQSSVLRSRVLVPLQLGRSNANNPEAIRSDLADKHDTRVFESDRATIGT